MTINTVRRPSDGAGPARLAAAAETIAARLAKQPYEPHYSFDLETKTHICASDDHRVWAQRDDTRGAWVVGSVSRVDSWSSVPHYCDGCLTAEDALAWAEQLWRAHSVAR